LNSFKRVWAEYPDSRLAREAMLNAGNILIQEGEFDSALLRFQEVVDKFPGTVFEKTAYRSIADIYRREKLPQQAIENYKMSLTDSDEQLDAEIHFEIGECLEEKGSYQEAASQYMEISYRYAQDKDIVARALLKAAAVFAENGQIDEAKRAYEKVVQLNTQDSNFAQERLRQLALKPKELEVIR
jgi:TolA-binding protein